MNKFKRLTPENRRRVNALIKNYCCNYDNGNCILLDDGDTCVCPQAISYSLNCKWFRTAVLPTNQPLYGELRISERSKRCVVCGNTFVANSNRAKYCDRCKNSVYRRQATERKRKQRSLSRFRNE